LADKKLFISTSLLIIIGVFFSYSLTSYISYSKEINQFYFFFKYLIVAIVSISAMWATSLLNPKSIKGIGLTFLFIFFLLMVTMNFLPSSMVVEAGGAKRWIRLPFFSLSPVEFFKIGFIIFLAWSFSRRLFKKRTLKEEIKVIIPYLFVFVISILLIAIMQNDLGQSIVLGSILTIMFLFAGVSAKFFMYSLVLFVSIFSVLITAFPHRIHRVHTWWSNIQGFILSIFPENIADAFRVSQVPQHYQIERSLDAINHGGLFGTGLGNSHYKYGFLPDIHTDFAFSGIIEEVGIVVAIAIILLMVFGVLYRILKVANRVSEPIYFLTCMGIFMLIAIPFLMNILGISGLIPIKGIGFPFISYGGSATLSLSIAVGLILSISKLSKNH